MLKKKWFRSLLIHRLTFALIILIQIAWIINTVINGSLTSTLINVVLQLLSLLVCVYIISIDERGTNKLSWVFLILLFPLLGGIAYVTFSIQISGKILKKRISDAKEKLAPHLSKLESCEGEAIEKFPHRATQIKYLCNSGFPIYKNTTTTFLTPGEEKLKALLCELEQAEKYIFLEYFIIKEGIMWNSILEVLARKAAQGVKVRIIYDDFGCFMLLPKDYPKRLMQLGIECKVFNRFSPFITAVQNNRDHRKIVCIDGRVAFTGGINLSDEYINAEIRHGHWKDVAIMIKGDAAKRFTMIFLEMWEASNLTSEDQTEYLNTKYAAEATDGYVQPYSNDPTDGKNTAEHVYLQIINNAKKYVYINTPYLIIDDTMLSALTLAAKSGVDVRITTPHIGDRWFVHTTTRSYYYDLIKAGVKIYEYTNGFVHAKTFVSDDEVATVGTVNLDYRSLYTHFECGVLLFGCRSIESIKNDYIKTLEICEEITPETCSSKNFKGIISKLLRIFAPFM